MNNLYIIYYISFKNTNLLMIGINLNRLETGDIFTYAIIFRSSLGAVYQEILSHPPKQ